MQNGFGDDPYEHTQSTDAAPRRRRASALTWGLLGAAAVIASGAAVGITQGAWAHAGFGRGHFGDRHHHRFGDDPERAKQHALFAIAWMLREVDASDEQQARAEEITSGLVDRFAPLVAAHHEQHEAFVAALGADAVDREALHRLREQTLELAEQGSVAVVDALVDLAEVLTPEQRRELLERAADHHH
jgi:Spy/CpxP family protein refolding chaperone